MTPEKRKELLHYAAENPNAKFAYENKSATFGASYVLAYPHYDWEIVKEPVVMINYYRLAIVNAGNGKSGYIDCHENNWDLRITTTDGVRVAELRENVK